MLLGVCLPGPRATLIQDLLNPISEFECFKVTGPDKADPGCKFIFGAFIPVGLPFVVSALNAFQSPAP